MIYYLLTPLKKLISYYNNKGELNFNCTAECI